MEVPGAATRLPAKKLSPERLRDKVREAMGCATAPDASPRLSRLPVVLSRRPMPSSADSSSWTVPLEPNFRGRLLGARLNRFARSVLLWAIGVSLVACSLVAEGPMPAGGRQLQIPVSNDSDRPAVLVVAEDAGTMGPQVGRSQPSVVPPRTRVNVTFTVPGTSSWAIFVNPGDSGVGPLIVARDVAQCVGVVPIEIQVDDRGDIFYSTPRQWCGDP